LKDAALSLFEVRAEQKQQLAVGRFYRAGLAQEAGRGHCAAGGEGVLQDHLAAAGFYMPEGLGGLKAPALDALRQNHAGFRGGAVVVQRQVELFLLPDPGGTHGHQLIGGGARHLRKAAHPHQHPLFLKTVFVPYFQTDGHIVHVVRSGNVVIITAYAADGGVQVLLLRAGLQSNFGLRAGQDGRGLARGCQRHPHGGRRHQRRRKQQPAVLLPVFLYLPRKVPGALHHQLLPGLSLRHAGQKLRHRHPQRLRKRLQKGNVRKARAGLPPGHGLVGNVQLFGQLLLGHSLLFSLCRNQHAGFVGVHFITSASNLPYA
jgi:hypothetical protein